MVSSRTWVVLYPTLFVSLFACILCSVSITATHLSSSNFNTVIDGSRYVLVKFDTPSREGFKKSSDEYEDVAKHFEGYKDVVVAFADKNEFPQYCSVAPVGEELPEVALFPKSKTPKMFKGEFSSKSCIDFVEKELKVSGKSRKKGVVILDDKTADSVINDPNKHVFVNFYAPWCGHCKSLAPIWDDFASKYVHEDVVIAKINADKNRKYASKYGVNGFPTLIAFPKGDKSGSLKYSNRRDVPSLSAFLDDIREKDSANSKSGLTRNEDLERVIVNLFKKSLTLKSALEEFVKISKRDTGNAISKETMKFYTDIANELSKSSDYVSNEIKRIKKLLEGTIQKADEMKFNARISILESIHSIMGEHGSSSEL